MIVLFDNCTAPKMAWTLGGYLRNSNFIVEHFKDKGWERKTDLEWIEETLHLSLPVLIFTGDGRIRKNKAERAAFKRAGLRGVVLAPAYQKTKMGVNCGTIVAKWDDLHSIVSRLDPPFLLELPMGLRTKLKTLPI